ncbi:hypothetical protein [Kibdelosporangium phytohabitans]|uniref:Uncharacterized protein n=1 Tax=Kibdelosporangium phytohabitans TaxID=860235 RepID=A0A0N9I0X3_9PSEU|nr:hypothetical protein [Kibdelosporangium phytohabitans]ALG13457.1 hypothetical protein AOZ06_47260 [Kibdelosporangium phytohabitans]MBE1465304.1 hypothetical protein [Kibdelosporangium phytohabitans]
MEYQLKAEVAPPAGTSELDALHRHGVVSLLDEQLDLLAGIEGPDGVEIEPLDHEVSAHPGGASIKWLVEAPALAFAEEAARAVLTELLERTELLANWSVGTCEVTVSDEDLETALEDEPADAEDELDTDAVELIELSGEELDERRDLLANASELVTALGTDSFGTEDGVSAEQAQLVAGALAEAVVVVIDELFDDVNALDEDDTTADQHDELLVIDELPTAFADQYSAWFAKRFLIATVIVGERLTEDEWRSPTNTAEALALHVLKGRARTELSSSGLLDEDTLKRAFAAFDETAFDDLEHEALYGEDAEGSVVDWLPTIAKA